MNNRNFALWMGDLEPWMDELFIMNSFIQLGFIPKSIKLIIDKRNNKSKNFCFVYFNNLEEANLALFNLNSKLIPNTNLYFKLNIIKYNTLQKGNIYVGNLSKKINDIELYNYFKSKYPSVYFSSIIADNGISRGYGFVHFANEEEYRKCLEEMDGTLFHNKIIKVKEKTYANNLDINRERINEGVNLQNDFDKTKVSKKESEKDLPSFSLEKFHKNNMINKENLELLKTDNINILNYKIKESIDKMVEYYKNNNKMNQLSKIILYYCNRIVNQ